MEPNFQTSFIPKKPMIEERVVQSNPIGFFAIISFFVFFTVLLASGGLYFYKISLEKKLVAMDQALVLAKNRFEPAKITQLQLLDERLDASSELLSKHVSVSPIFKALQAITMKTIRYTKFSYDLNTEKDTKVSVKMSGVAVGYRSVALQSDLFTANKYFIDPAFSNLSLDDKGNVIFDLEFLVDPKFVDYRESIKVDTESALLDISTTGEVTMN